jgi:Plasmid encoded RepA protein
LLAVDRRFKQGTAESDERRDRELPEAQKARKEPSKYRRKRDDEAVLSLTEAMYSESAAGADALGFMAKMLVQTTLPHRAQPGKQYTRTDGDVTLSITDLGGVGLPYGAYPRLILVWMTTEALRTSERKLELGRSLSSFMGQLGLQCTGGHWGTIPRFRGQMERLFGAAISTRWKRDESGQTHAGGSNLLLAEEFNLWWTPQKLPQSSLGHSSVTLSQRFFEQLVEAPVPLDLRAIKVLKRSPLSLDLYAWATRRVSYLKRPLRMSWTSFQRSFGAGYAETPQGRSRFRGNAIEALGRVKVVYPQLKIEIQRDGILLNPSLTHVPKALLG